MPRTSRTSVLCMTTSAIPCKGYYDFLVPYDQSRCRVIEVWRKESKARVRCHDVNNGDVFKVDMEDFKELVLDENEKRMQQARELGMSEDDVPLIRYEWFMDSYWYYYMLTPFGDILEEGRDTLRAQEPPLRVQGIPVHRRRDTLIREQRDRPAAIHQPTDNDVRLDNASVSQGVLLFPEECLPKGHVDGRCGGRVGRFNGIIMIKQPKTGQALPQQIANNCTQIGISGC